ncbi:MAG: sensor histidine kinase [Pseudomonadota bacterium]
MTLNIARHVFHVAALLTCALLIATPIGLAQEAVGEAFTLVLSDKDDYDLSGNIAYAFDPERSRSAELLHRSDEALAFAAVGFADPSFGFNDDAIWLRIMVDNPGDIERDMRLVMRTNFMTELKVWRESEGDIELALDQSTEMPFSTRPIANPFLVAPLVFPRNSQSTVYIRYISKGGTALPMSLQSPNRLAETAQYRAARLFLFYAIVGVLALGSIASFVALRRPIFLAYGAYAVAVVIYLAQLDGVAFQYFWPESPGWNGYASLPLGCLVGVCGAVFARIFLETERTDRLAHWALVVVIIGCCVLPFSPILIGERAAKAAATLWVTGAAVAFLVIGLRALVARPRLRVWFFMLGWFGMVTASLFISAKGFTNAPLGRDLSLDIIRMATVFDAFMMGMAVLIGLLAIRREHDLSTKQRLEQFDRNLSLHKRLNDLENRYGVAVEEVELRGRVLSEASHDIRQPLFALRAAMHKLGNGSGVEADDVASNLDYLEALVNDFISRSGLQSNDLSSTPRADRAPVSVVLSAIENMFAEDAAQKGICLRVMPSSAVMSGDAMSVLRIVSNFVANAIQHSGSDKIVVGCRRRGGQLSFEVHDRGQGMTADCLERVTDPKQSGENVTTSENGSGLGLSIVWTLARREGYAPSARSTPGRGSCFALAVSGAPMIKAPRLIPALEGHGQA